MGSLTIPFLELLSAAILPWPPPNCPNVAEHARSLLDIALKAVPNGLDRHDKVQISAGLRLETGSIGHGLLVTNARRIPSGEDDELIG